MACCVAGLYCSVRYALGWLALSLLGLLWMKMVLSAIGVEPAIVTRERKLREMITHSRVDEDEMAHGLSVVQVGGVGYGRRKLRRCCFTTLLFLHTRSGQWCGCCISFVAMLFRCYHGIVYFTCMCVRVCVCV